MNILMLVTDAYGGHGGIAHYNRGTAEALCELKEIEQITLLPRIGGPTKQMLRGKIRQEGRATISDLDYFVALGIALLHRTNLIFCGHLNLLPVAWVCAKLKRCPLILQVHGIEAWSRPDLFRRLVLRRANAVWSVSQFTLNMMNKWARLDPRHFQVIPNSIRLQDYSPGLPPAGFLSKLGLEGKKVLLTLGRLDSRERYKGIDEILDCLPQLLEREPSLVYVIAGEGDDRSRLQDKSRSLGISDRVVFTGFIGENDKLHLLRSARVFAMPGTGEGFGIVYLEALACGVPVIGSTRDGSFEALRGGKLGAVVDPSDTSSLIQAILGAINHRPSIPAGIEYFDRIQHVLRLREALRAVLGDPFVPVQ